MERVYVLYHGNCYDGFGAAYAAWKKLGDSATYLPVSYGQPRPMMENATKVYIVDFSYPLDVLAEIAEYVCDVVVIDHHKTAKEALEKFKHPRVTVFFDMTKSGALMTWEYFHRYPAEAPSDIGLPVPAPLLIQHISDRDLWKFEMPGSREIHKALVSYPMDFATWDAFDVEKLKEEGKACARLHDQLVKSTCEKAFTTKIDVFHVPVVNTAIAWSEVGEELLRLNPAAPFVASFTVMKYSIMWSLRSRPDFDVSVVAKKFGGGGHAQAAGFKTVRA
jgi:oligoribonuclease NrnB/cAMP/cGMP phosphodiesterase (DHH superfamily)